MATLVFELAGPLQAWGVTEGGARRPTSAYPSKSGVIGMVAAALGLDRQHNLEHLYELQFGVRVDRPGVVLTDYHTARRLNLVGYGYAERLAGYPSEPQFEDASLSYRGYIADAVFTVALTGDESLLSEVAEALRAPRYLLYMGRRG